MKMRADEMTQDQPSGTVTFLFTDKEGSTELLDQLGEKYRLLLADQRTIIRSAFDTHQGHEIDTQGDAFFASFARTTDAVTAVVNNQRTLAEHCWSNDVQVRDRLGLHTGEPLSAEGGYEGMDVQRVVRIAQVGHGGYFLDTVVSDFFSPTPTSGISMGY